MSRSALDVDPPVVAIDNAIHCRESQTHAVAFLFGCKKGLEDVWQLVFRDSGACVRNRNGTMGFISMIMTLDANISTFRHGVDGIENQVDDALFQLIGVSLDCRKIRLKGCGQGNVLQLEFVLAQGYAFLDKFLNLNRAHGRRRFSGKGQEI